MTIKSFFTTRVYEPLYYKAYRNDETLKFFNLYKRLQWSSLENNKKFQAKRLYALVKYASENIPYYKRIVKNNKIKFSEETIFEDIRKFPVLTKDLIRKEFDNLYKAQQGVKWYYNNSGGSTGEPVKLIQDNNMRAESYAITRLQFEWADYELGETQIKLWGSEKDILKEKDHVKHKLANWARSVYLLNSFMMDESMMRNYVNFINKKRPKMILAYVQSIFELAKFIKKNNIKVFHPKSIMTSAGLLHLEARQTIEEVFKCPVFNRYGSREVGDAASECEKHEGLHTSMFTHYIEILDKNLKQCREGQTGEIYVTLLNNFTMPLIRYKIGDLGAYTDKKCSCGRGLPLIQQIIGRTNSMLKTNKGVFDSVAISVLLYFFKDGVPFQSFSKYQIIQEKKTKIIFKIIVTDHKLWQAERKRIEEKFNKVLGSDVDVIFKEVESIPPLKSGKYSYIINKMKNE